MSASEEQGQTVTWGRIGTNRHLGRTATVRQLLGEDYLLHDRYLGMGRNRPMGEIGADCYLEKECKRQSPGEGQGQTVAW